MDARARRYLVVDRFFPEARELRREFDRRLADRAPPFDPSRIAWEYWHVPGQFSQLRAPARDFFPRELAAAFERRLLRWAGLSLGLAHLGGPPWLSVLTGGGFQAIHRDSPNGEFAFSYGLVKPSSPRFRGGETLLARPELLDYFRAGSHRADSAHTPLFDEVTPLFNRLVVFDARIPHGVRAVEGSRDARDGRVAIQGWLKAGGCVVDGEADAVAATATVGRCLRAAALRGKLRGVDGLLTVRLEVTRQGRVRALRALMSTLVSTRGAETEARRAEVALLARLGSLRFSSAKAPARIIAPIVVRDGRATVPP